MNAVVSNAPLSDADKKALAAAAHQAGLPPDVDLMAVKRLLDAALSALTTLSREKQILATAIGDAARKAGIVNGDVQLTGPHLLMLLDDMATAIASEQAPRATPPTESGR